MTLTLLSPAETRRRVEHGQAVLVDIREPDERGREYIAAARSMPLSQFTNGAASSETLPVVFHCQSGNRTTVNADRLSRSGTHEMFVMAGGLNAWKAAGFPTVIDRRQPLPLQRQVMIAAGSIIIVSLALAAFVSPWFAAVTAFMGCGLTFAGLSGWCGLAKLLERMPWNRAPRYPDAAVRPGDLG